ncbi:hypothetical protein [Enterovibrio norvegicus]|uniref:hypothetical protein n=1 Tax=Enterovibrio norvegicus TaxID=188144 RepID=UPI000C868353|nr:hypothetical protein [Enterovibrio norvegicus]PMH72137.1 hypothetical protein BCU62_03720 [Enterovibrio norvegicus]
MRKIIIAVGLLAASSSVFAGTMGNDLDLRVVTVTSGSWVQVLQNGEPVEGATVSLSGTQTEHVTSENGRVFVMAEQPYTRSGTFSAVTTDGIEISKRVVLPRDRND